MLRTTQNVRVRKNHARSFGWELELGAEALRAFRSKIECRYDESHAQLRSTLWGAQIRGHISSIYLQLVKPARNEDPISELLSNQQLLLFQLLKRGGLHGRDVKRAFT